jgi:hypothetical protein
VSLGLFINGLYLLSVVAQSFGFTYLFWAIFSLICSYGLFKSQPWVTLLIVVLSSVSIFAWFDGILQSINSGWQPPNIQDGFVALLPGIALTIWWFVVSVYAVKKHNKPLKRD